MSKIMTPEGTELILFALLKSVFLDPFVNLNSMVSEWSKIPCVSFKANRIILVCVQIYARL